eukprot:c23559_g1_i7 orf=325-954(-)
MTRPSRTPNTSRGMVTITGERHCANCRRVASQSMLVCLLVLISRLPLAVAEYAPYGQQVLLESVKSITLHKGRETTYRRTFSIPQLKCLSGCDYQPDVVQCQNKWSDGKDVQWDCDADLPSGVQFGWTEVICEGYKSAEDKYVLEGSCGLEYSLKHTGGHLHGPKKRISENNRPGSGKGSLFSQLFAFIIAIYIGYSFYRICFQRGVLR